MSDVVPFAACGNDVVKEDLTAQDRVDQGDRRAGEHTEDNADNKSLVGNEELQQTLYDGALLDTVRTDTAVLVFVNLTAFRALRVELVEDRVFIADLVTAERTVNDFAECVELLALGVGTECLDLGDGILVPFLVDFVFFVFGELFIDFRTGRIMFQNQKTVRSHARIDGQIRIEIKRKAVKVSGVFGVGGFSEIFIIRIVFCVLFGDRINVRQNAVNEPGVFVEDEPAFTKVAFKVQVHPYGDCHIVER